MTANSQTKSSVLYQPTPVQAFPAVALCPPATRAEWQWWGVGLTLIGIFYAALVNPYWVPSGDGDLYLAIGRSLALGNGLRFNGQAVNICPPGWPLVLAGLMKISPTFLCFKVFLILCQTLQLGMWYWVLKRLVPVKLAVMGVALTAILNHVYSLTFWTHTEALYCLIATGATLVAMQLAEGKSGRRWRIALLLFLCFMCVFIRWAGTLQFVIIAAALLHRMPFWNLRQPAVRRQWYIAIACAVTLVGSLVLLRSKFKLTRAQAQAAAEAGAVFESQESEAVPPAQVTEESKEVAVLNFKVRELTLPEELWRRFNESGRWLSWLCWQPFRFTASVPRLASVDIVVGWIAMLVILVPLIKGTARFHWIWIGAVAYCSVLMINWPNANARYLVPIAPLLLAGIVMGAKEFFGPWRIRRKVVVAAVLVVLFIATAVTLVNVFTQFVLSPAALWTITGLVALRLMLRGDENEEYPLGTRWLRNTFVATVILCNLGLYGIDVSVFRSMDFYGRYEAGFNSEIISICHHLNQANLENKELAVSERYVNFNRPRKSKYSTRAAVLLTNRTVWSVRDKEAGSPPKTALLRWITTQRSKPVLARSISQGDLSFKTIRAFYLDQRPNIPWRVWHFKLSRDFNQQLVREPLGPDSGGWKLFELKLEQVPPSTQPTTVPAKPKPQRPATTQPSTRPTQAPHEWKRTVLPIEVPRVTGWPTRVPGM